MNQIKVIFLLLLFLLTFLSIAQNKTKLGYFIESEDFKTSPIASVSIKHVDLDTRFGEISIAEETALSFKSFSEQGNLIEETYYHSDGSLSRQFIYKYDVRGNQTESSSYDSDSNLVGQHKHKYDLQGNKIESSSYNSDGSLDWQHRYKYDRQGNKIKFSSYDSDGSLSKQFKYKYDRQGSLLGESAYNSEGSLTEQKKCEYDYDRYSNWIKKTCLDYIKEFDKWQPDYSNTNDEVTIRVIEYHK